MPMSPLIDVPTEATSVSAGPRVEKLPSGERRTPHGAKPCATVTPDATSSSSEKERQDTSTPEPALSSTEQVLLVCSELMATPDGFATNNSAVSDNEGPNSPNQIYYSFISKQIST